MKPHKLFLIILLTCGCASQAYFVAAKEEFIYDSKHKRDPFAPLVSRDGEYIVPFAEVKSISDIKLEGIIWDPKGGSLAVINGKILKEGEMFEGAQVHKIYPDKIVILMQEQEFTINLVTEEENENGQSQTSPDKDFGSF